MRTIEDHAVGIGLSTLAAGPLMVLTSAFGGYYAQLPAAVPVERELLGSLVAAAAVAMFVGIPVALPINSIGTAAMLALGDRFAPLRSRAAWALSGGLLGMSGGWLLSAEPWLLFSLTTTSALCGWICLGTDAMDAPAAGR
ncbi:hypothetical protein FHS95_000412 [Sphingomonas naasensis]|uniref:Uncharacterized protein n=1 Tax=Sphingomonas naasensis TaxID=1344951 RepID=A0A4S1WRG5_9SPHN|nr:hypothetical protein [Sphingomonas naasensis]NIJ18743.1 hypothetical protein [Sphingomonas naasensis]TGX45978.1 hypothetical protein E5A74_02040 [Sphingomonas naasensis]